MRLAAVLLGLVASAGGGSARGSAPGAPPALLPLRALRLPITAEAARAQLHDHGYVLLAPTPAFTRTAEAAETATRQLFDLDAGTKGRIDAAMRVHGPCDRTELQLWCTGLRVNPAACASAYSPKVQQHEQFHIVFDEAAMGAMAWPAEDVPALRRAVLDAGNALQSVSEDLLEAVAPEMLELRAAQVVKRGDPSVLDLFRYRGCSEGSSCSNDSTDSGGMRMDSHVVSTKAIPATALFQGCF